MTKTRNHMPATGDIGGLAETMLRKSEDKYRLIAENTADVISIWDMNLRAIYISPSVKRLRGYTVEEAMILPYSQFILPEFLPLIHEVFTEEMFLEASGTANPERIRILELEEFCKDGSTVWVEVALSFLRDEHQKPVGILSITRDITERKAAEMLRHAEARYRALFEYSPNGVLLIDPETGYALEVNDIAHRQLGYTREELLALRISDYEAIETPEATAKHVQRILNKGSDEFETLHRTKSGEMRNVRVRAKKIQLGGRILCCVNYEDITERKQAREALSSKQQQLEELNLLLEQRIQEAVAELRRKDQILINQSRLAAMGEMIGNIAHQWRQPLNALSLIIANIKDAYQFNTLDAAYLNQAAADGNRLIQKMSSTISDFANFFRPDKETMTFSAKKQIDAAILLVESSFSNCCIAICFEAPHDLMLSGFPNEYSQVLLNLLYNAKDAILARKRTDESEYQIEKGKIFSQPSQLPSGRVEIRLTEQDGQGCVTVADNGGGIPADILDKVFEPYFSTKKMGTGIGLYMSKMIIERNMNGSIDVQNIKGGARFNVCTPLAA